MPLNDSVRQQISDLIASHRVVLFMKGTPRAPQCGFSAQVASILDQLGPQYEGVDVLRSPELREGIKEFSEWPTIPQLFIDGQFVGGCDIVRELHQSGELQQLLGAIATEPERPTIALSEAAVSAFAAAMSDAGGDALRLSIDGSFKHDLFFGPAEPGDVEVQANGLALRLDRASARRATGVSIDFIDGPNGGFKITNPNAPPTVKQLTAPELKAMLDRGQVVLFDVRPPSESALASIAGARSLDAAGQQYLLGLPRDTPVAFYCHHGVRSHAAAEQVLRENFRTVYNLGGGIDAWSQLVDPSVPRY